VGLAPVAVEPPPPTHPEPEPSAPSGDGGALVSGDGGAPPAHVVKLVKRGPTRYPLVLAHGFGGFDSLAIRGKRLDYFRGVSERLRASGVDVHVLRVSPLASIVARAQQLAAQIERLGCERVNIVAHSMGGLDARYAIACLGMAPRIASLTTIGTPHRGTPLADLGALSGAFGRLSGRLGAIHDLSPRQMAAFNLAVDDVPGVAYGCVVAAARGGMSRVHTLLVPGYLFLRRQAGDNDGVVPASSQRWGAVWGEIDADHWGAVGWSSAFDAAAFYERLAWDLGQRGF
jgi:triacylglycerol lipase